MDLSNPVFYIMLAGLIGMLISIGIWIGKIEYFRGTVDKMLREIRDDIKKIFERLPSPETVESNSPRRLTDLGKDISKHLKASTWAESESDKLFSGVQGKQPYEIEELSFEHVERRADSLKPFSQRIQKCSYERGVSIGGVKAVFAIELRDALLKRISHKG